MDIGRELVQLRRDLARVERAARLNHASLENTAITVNDADGVPRAVIGMQADGTAGLVAQNGPAPGAPTAPGVTPSMAGLRVVWDGSLADSSPLPADFDHVAVHVSTSSGFTPSSATFVGTITHSGDGGMLPVTPLPYQEHYVVLVAVNTSGSASGPSAETAATPLQVDGPDLAAGSVTAATIQAGAVTAEKLEAVLELATRLVAGDPAGARVELNEDGLRVYNATGSLVIRFDAADGSAAFTGAISGSTVTGGLIQTATTGERITVNESGNNRIYFYDSTNKVIASFTSVGVSIAGPDGNVISLSPAVRVTGSTATYAAIRWVNAAQTKFAKIISPASATGELELQLQDSTGNNLYVREGATELSGGRLRVFPPASSNSAVYVEADTAHTGNLLSLYRDGSYRLTVDKDGNTTVTGNLTVSGTVTATGRVKPSATESANLSLQSGWTNSDATNYGTAQVRRTATGQAYLIGRLAAGTTTSGTTIATIPAGFWPTIRHAFPYRVPGVNVGATLIAYETGEIRIWDTSGTITNVSLASLNWPLF